MSLVCDGISFDRRMAKRSWGARIAHLAIATALLTAPISVTWARSVTPNNALESRPTAAGAVATDKHWSLAEWAGDTAFLGHFLLPGYVSVSNDGSVHSKAHIIAGAANRAGTDVASAKRAMEAYAKAHPHGTSTVLYGNLAVISFYNPELGPEKGVTSSDVMVYADGSWHAIYSQHTGVRP
jgi:hypothetical protein